MSCESFKAKIGSQLPNAEACFKHVYNYRLSFTHNTHFMQFVSFHKQTSTLYL